MYIYIERACNNWRTKSAGCIYTYTHIYNIHTYKHRLIKKNRKSLQNLKHDQCWMQRQHALLVQPEPRECDPHCGGQNGNNYVLLRAVPMNIHAHVDVNLPYSCVCVCVYVLVYVCACMCVCMQESVSCVNASCVCHGICMCVMGHLPYVWREIFIGVTVHVCDVTSSICVTRIIHTCDITSQSAWQYYSMCVTLILDECDMSHSYIWGGHS